MIGYSLISLLGGREINEDCAMAEQKGDAFCAVVCDGLGGHESGELASSCVCECMIEQFRDWDGTGELQDCLAMWIDKAQEILTEKQIELGKTNGMRTTLCCLLISGKKAAAAHVGDSRIYRLRNWKVKERSRDHSLPQYLMMMGEIKEKDIPHHPDRNKLLRVMGIEWEKPQYQLWTLPDPTPGDAYVLCSDGFWEWLSEGEMQMTKLLSSDAESWLDKMKNRVLRNGEKANKANMDNCTAVTVVIS